MASKRVAVASGQPFNIPENGIISSVSGSWQLIGEVVRGRAVRVQGVYWSTEIVGAKLLIRDIERHVERGGVTNQPGVTWYEADCLGPDPAIDLFSAHLTLFLPFEYYSSGSAGDKIVIYGEFV
ncbi:hypothetical protein LCGC14_0954180 [marine sediment metagenome]|uniref:Uncharacterized protein n=1 Tax=marine sediment metagenome TaxID=412755 RepID=A0A0F9NKX3_9ZZZZ